MKETSPSSLPKLDECTVFVPTENAGPAAQRGTNIDLAIRTLICGDTNAYHALPPEDRPAAKWGADKLIELAGLHHIETREEYLGMCVPGLSRPGTADAVCAPARWVADIKTGANRDYRGQLSAYSLACMDEHFAEEWTAHVVFVDLRLVRSWKFTREAAEARLADTIARITSPDAQPTPGEYCGWCANRDTCKALVRQSTEALALVAGTTSLTEIRERLLANPVELSAFAANWKTAEKEIAKPALDALKTRLLSGEDIPGWKVTESTRRSVGATAIAAAAANVSKETLILAMGGSMSADDFTAFCAANGVEVNPADIQEGAKIATLRQSKTKTTK